MSPITHIFYADDMLIFTNGRLKSLRCLRKLMTHYEEASGQKINLQKSSFYASKNILPSRLIQIQRTSGFWKKNMPFKYLGALIYKGRCQASLFEEIFAKFATKLEGWHSRYLSFGGKITLFSRCSLVCLFIFSLAWPFRSKCSVVWKESYVLSCGVREEAIGCVGYR